MSNLKNLSYEEAREMITYVYNEYSHRKCTQRELSIKTGNEFNIKISTKKIASYTNSFGFVHGVLRNLPMAAVRI